MDQRQPRLGDIVDDYCPRERRITNHAVAVVVGSEIKQTRCTTCETEHIYKHAKVPARRKKKDSPAALYEQVLAAKSDEAGTQPSPMTTPDEPLATATTQEDSADMRAPLAAGAEDSSGVEPEPTDEGPVHRPLIRATLPRPEGQPAGRPMPDFTVRHARNGAGFRDDPRKPARAGGWPQGNGSRPGRGRPRPGRPGPGGRPGPFSAAGNRSDRLHQQPGRTRSGRRRPGKNRSK